MGVVDSNMLQMHLRKLFRLHMDGNAFVDEFGHLRIWSVNLWLAPLFPFLSLELSDGVTESMSVLIASMNLC